MHILYILYKDNPSSGGSFRVAEGLIKGLKTSSNFSYTVCFMYGGKGCIGRENAENCIYLGAKQGYAYLSLFRFLFLISRLKITVVHFVDPAYWLQIFFIFFRKKSVMHVHGAFWSKPKQLKQRILWWISRQSIAKFIAITHTVKDNLILHKFAKASNVDVVYNSIDFEKIKKSKNWTNNVNIPNECKVIGSVGRIVEGRGFDDLIRMLQFLTPNWCVLIVGDGPYLEKLKKLSIDLKFRDRVYFSGQVDDVTPYYNMMDVYGFFARYESFGLALADAMLFKKPIFGLQGAGEYGDSRYPLITIKNSTFIMRPNHLDQWRREDDDTLIKLARKINEYELNPNQYKVKCDNAFEHIAMYFNLDIQTQKILKIYKAL